MNDFHPQILLYLQAKPATKLLSFLSFHFLKKGLGIYINIYLFIFIPRPVLSYPFHRYSPLTLPYRPFIYS